jgi:hypothetical protein
MSQKEIKNEVKTTTPFASSSWLHKPMRWCGLSGLLRWYRSHFQVSNERQQKMRKNHYIFSMVRDLCVEKRFFPCSNGVYRTGPEQ